jgi:hypothetical protein
MAVWAARVLARSALTRSGCRPRGGLSAPVLVISVFSVRHRGWRLVGSAPVSKSHSEPILGQQSLDAQADVQFMSGCDGPPSAAEGSPRDAAVCIARVFVHELHVYPH